MAGTIQGWPQNLSTGIGVYGQYIPPGNPSNIQLVQTTADNPFPTGPQHIPQAWAPIIRTPIKLPWGAGSAGIRV